MAANTTTPPSAFPGLRVRASAWLADIARGGTLAPATELAERCLSAVAALPADERMLCFNRNVNLTTTLCLEFLSSLWMRDEHVNAGFDFIAQQLGPNARTVFMLCWHLHILHGYRYGHDGSRDPLRAYNPTCPRYGDKEICMGYVDRAFIPCFVNGNHWTLFTIDLQAHTISYFDPMYPHAVAPPETLSDLRWWLTGLVPGHLWPLVPCPAASRVQTDGSSCGIVILSEVASRVLGYPSWTQDTWKEHRIEWFMRLTQFWHDDTLLSIQDMEIEHGDSDAPLPSVPTTVSEDIDMDELEAPQDATEACAPWIEACRAQSVHPDQSLAPSAEASTPPRPVSPDDVSSLRSALSDYLEVLPTLPHMLDESDDGDATPPREKRHAPPESLPASPSKRLRRAPAHARPRRVQTPEQRLATFRRSILEVDPDAKFIPSNTRAVRCSNCGEVVRAHKEYETGRFRLHRGSCQPRGRHILQALRSVPADKIISIPSQRAPPQRVPCPGLTILSDRRVADYLRHSAMPGGGAASRSSIARELYGRAYVHLSDQQKRRVRVKESHGYRWLNRHGLQSVFSPQCQQIVSATDPATPSPCAPCWSVLSIKEFRNALARPIPPDDHLKFVPECWREPATGHLYLRYHGLSELVDKNITKPAQMVRDFAQGVLSGKYKEDGVFLGAIEAMVEKKSREARGKSLRNMKYPEAFDNACLTLRSISSRAYELFRSIWGGRIPRSARTVERRSRKFAPGLSPENVKAAAEILKSYSYAGPVIVCCDDTKLEPGLREYYLSSGAWVIVGQAGEPVQAEDEASVDALLEDAETQLADKLRAWILIIPVPKVPPIILVTDARGSSEDAETLFDRHKKVWGMLNDCSIFPIAYASDGAETERNVQRLITKSAPSTDRYTIPNSQRGCEIVLDVPLFNGRPLVMVQDSKHALKTARNQLFSGARALALGDGAMYYTLVRDIADHQDSPLYRRDVESVDRQDDHAASRLFSAETLTHHHKVYPQRRSLGVYLYFIGSLFDSWQSRTMPHTTRILIALRTRFFLQAWRAHIVAHPDHSPAHQFISRESEDIFVTLANSLIALVLSYRKYYPDCPLLPWLHSTEPGEHVYGVSRMVRPDFTYADFLELVPKIGQYLMGEFATIATSERASLTASGYWHTWTRNTDIDLAAAVCWPSDDDIARLSVIALSDVRTILSAVGIHVNRIIHLPLRKPRNWNKPQTKSKAKPKPGAKSRKTTSQTAVRARRTVGKVAQPNTPTRIQPKRNVVSLAREPGLLFEWNKPDEPRSLSELRALRDGIQFEEPALRKELDATAAAIAAADMDESNTILELPEMDDAAHTRNAEKVLAFAKTAGSTQAPSQPFPQPLFAPGQPFNFDVLIANRRAQQNGFTSGAVRKGLQKKAAFPSATAVDSTLATLKARLAAKFCELVGKASNAAGYSRLHRWGCDSNTLDKDKVAAARLEKSQKHDAARRTALRPLIQIDTRFSSANIAAIRPLTLSHPTYVLVYLQGSNPRVALGEVLAMYTVTGRRHAAVDCVDAPGLLSYILVQVFTPASGSTYTNISTTLGTATFAHLPPTHLLFSFGTFDISRKDVSDGSMTILSPEEQVINIIDMASNDLDLIEKCVTAFKKALKPSAQDEEEKGSSDGEDA